MSVPTERQCSWSNDPICPYCGHVQSDFWEYPGEDGDCDCGDCGRRFMWSRHIEVTFSTTSIIGPHQLCDYTIRTEALEES